MLGNQNCAPQKQQTLKGADDGGKWTTRNRAAKRQHRDGFKSCRWANCWPPFGDSVSSSCDRRMTEGLVWIQRRRGDVEIPRGSRLPQSRREWSSNGREELFTWCLLAVPVSTPHAPVKMVKFKLPIVHFIQSLL